MAHWRTGALRWTSTGLMSYCIDWLAWMACSLQLCERVWDKASDEDSQMLRLAIYLLSDIKRVPLLLL